MNKGVNVVILVCFSSLVFLKCTNDDSDKLIFLRGEKSVEYQMWRMGWEDTALIITDNYNSGISYLEDNLRGQIFIFDNSLHLLKVDSKTGLLADSLCIICRYWKHRDTKKNKLLYAYPALFYYHNEELIHLDMDFNVKADYSDSLITEEYRRFPNGHTYELFIDSVWLMPPDKVWVRMNDEHGNIEVMIFGVNTTMEAPVIYSTYIFR